MTVEQFSNLAQTTLNGAITVSATSIVVNSAANFPSSGQFRIVIDQEICLVLAVAGTTFTVARGCEGSTAASHSDGAAIAHVLTAAIIAPVYAKLRSDSPLNINALGDSISSQGAYYPTGASLAAAPVWQASTAYIVGNVVQNGGLAYRCTTAGTSASSGGPSGVNASITDNGAVWAYIYPFTQKRATDYLYWVEAFSRGKINYDLTLGYQGIYSTIKKIIVKAGGSNYSPSDTVTLNNGATATLTVASGVITACTIVNPGYENGTAFTLTINTSTGSGAVLSLVECGKGTFGVPGCTTTDMAARIDDVTASGADILCILGGTNDISSATATTAGIASAYTTITANLRTCYEKSMDAGIKVCAIKVLQRTGLTGLKITLWHKVNHFIEAYCRGDSWANPSGYSNIVLADTSRFFADGTGTGIDPIGGSGAGIGAMTQDGLHPSSRGAQYIGLAVLDACTQWFGKSPAAAVRSATMADGFDINFNPNGNCIESQPWQASTAYIIGQSCNNDTGKFYRCKTAGTSASSGGPTGTGSTINDGSVQWAYVRPQGASLFSSGTQSMPGSAGSVTCSGILDASWNLSRSAGSAAGTIIGSIENPWSDGQTGKRQVIAFSLGSGSHNEWWQLYLNNFGNTSYGIPTNDLGVGQYYVEAELELYSVANLIQTSLELFDAGSNQAYMTRSGFWLSSGSSSHLTQMNSNGEMLLFPGTILIRTAPMAFPSNLTSLYPKFGFVFDASGGAGSATAVIKINYVAIRRAGSA